MSVKSAYRSIYKHMYRHCHERTAVFPTVKIDPSDRFDLQYSRYAGEYNYREVEGFGVVFVLKKISFECPLLKFFYTFIY